jgi:hypothetical protein
MSSTPSLVISLDGLLQSMLVGLRTGSGEDPANALHTGHDGDDGDVDVVTVFPHGTPEPFWLSPFPQILQTGQPSGQGQGRGQPKGQGKSSDAEGNMIASPAHATDVRLIPGVVAHHPSWTQEHLH